ncbi:MAG: hypothetical protein ACK52I_32595 [Pseudomonadota bacterium]|jgi:hypothetical protein
MLLQSIHNASRSLVTGSAFLVAALWYSFVFADLLSVVEDVALHNPERILASPQTAETRDIASFALAQSSPRAPSTSTPARTSLIPDRLSPGYNGDDATVLWYSLLGIDFERGQFEKTTEYENRMKWNRLRSVYLDKDMDSIFFFSVNLSPKNFFYDPDKEIFYFSAGSEISSQALVARLPDRIPLNQAVGAATKVWSKTQSTIKTGRTAGGILSSYTVNDTEALWLYYCTKDMNPACERTTTTLYKIYASPSHARNLINDLRVLIAGQLSYRPFRFDEFIGLAPTLQFPFQNNEKQWRIYVDAREFAFYKISTGEVIASYSLPK